MEPARAGASSADRFARDRAGALVRALFGAFARRDAEAVVALVDPVAFELHVPTATQVRGGEPYRGADGVRRYFADVARVWDQLEVELDEVRAAPGGERVLALGRIRAYGAGRIVDAPTGWVWHVREGRLVSGRVFETRHAALAAFEA